MMDLLTVNETARLLRVSPITIRRYIASGKLSAERVGRGVRVRREAIEDFVTPIAPSAGKLENGLDDDLVEIYSPSSPDEEEAEPDELVGQPFTMDDPLWNMFGIGESDDPTEVAENKHEYLAEAYLSDKG